MDPKWLEWVKKLQAIAAEIMATYSNVEPSYVLNLFKREVGYATPKVDVRGAVFHGDTLLLVREREDGCWTLPGGWADVGESPSEVAVREVYEESGYHTRAVKLLAVYDRNKHGHPPLVHHVYKLFFQCELLSGCPSPSIETDEVGFFCENEIPELSLTRIMPAQVARLFEHYRHPG